MFTCTLQFLSRLGSGWLDAEIIRKKVSRWRDRYIMKTVFAYCLFVEDIKIIYVETFSRDLLWKDNFRKVFKRRAFLKRGALIGF